MSNTKTAVLLMAYGTPRSREEILPYYTDIRRGRPPTEEQLSDLTARYEAIGGLSPLAALTEAQRDALQTALNNIAPNTYHVALGLKHAAPMIEDAVQQLAQEGFIKIYDNISKFRMQGSFEGWIRRIMVNTAINKIRAGKRQFEELDDRMMEVSNNQDVLDNFSAKDILNLISEMPAGYKYVFNMYAIEGFSHKEIADSLGIKEASSRSQYSKAKKYLQQKLIELQNGNKQN